jgi:UDPglucose 6-dehydrogenase
VNDVLRIGVVGTGYLGTVHAACLADLGHEVVAIDVDEHKIAALAAGDAPFYEPGLDELLARVLPTGRLRLTTDFSALGECSVVFLCVGTPLDPDGAGLSLRQLDSAVDAMAPALPPDCLVVGKSTTPVGTAAHLLARLRAARGPGIRLAWNPEFLREGHAIDDTVRPSRLVYGLMRGSDADLALLDTVYAETIAHGVPRLVTGLETAELLKGAANAFLATKISFINTVADLCEASGADIVELAEALGLDDRIGRAFLGAGVGFGGGCLPKDLIGFADRARELGVTQTADLLEVVGSINQGRRSRVVGLASEMLGGAVAGARVAVLGFAFKPESDDTRDSPALAVAAALRHAGADVRLHDPRAELPADSSFLASATPEEALDGAQLVLHMTEWAEYRKLDPVALRDVVARPLVIDGRNRLDAARWREAGWTYRGMGLAAEE